MSRVLPFFPKRPRSRYRTDWSRFLDGQVHELRRGVDFVCSTDSMRATLRRAADRKGLRIRTAVESDDVFIVQAFDGSAEAAE